MRVKKKVVSVLSALALMLGIGVATATAAQAWTETVGPFGSLSTCDYQRYQYGLAYGAGNISACWQYGSGANATKWGFWVRHN